MTNQQAIITDKLNVNNFIYPQEDVLFDKPDQQKIRNMQLQKAMKLGNMNKQAVKIHFKTTDKTERVTEATVWAVTQKYVILKAANMIPLKSITRVVF